MGQLRPVYDQNPPHLNLLPTHCCRWDSTTAVGWDNAHACDLCFGDHYKVPNVSFWPEEKKILKKRRRRRRRRRREREGKGKKKEKKKRSKIERGKEKEKEKK
ncbi:hypothetical protein ES288_D04G173300v1 [Gossypium darwinii]|uniref:Uncharacterized protein n=1 Tax=Gossypium darwinii TaxID=34276 RepID=A0A5D2CXT7_GOSDA|nr:hypothetical protein ES288_D04G173300v1 [Gossypium darwinii]